jgi:hypothetical protein
MRNASGAGSAGGDRQTVGRIGVHRLSSAFRQRLATSHGEARLPRLLVLAAPAGGWSPRRSCAFDFGLWKTGGVVVKRPEVYFVIESVAPLTTMRGAVTPRGPIEPRAGNRP